MNKLYDLITWHNDTTPALNEDNLNAMSEAIDDIDDRVIELGGYVLETVPEIQNLVNALEQLSQNPPYIGANGNWYVFDTNTETYVDSGVDASITITIADVTAIAPDATPYVTNTGTNTDPIYHFFIPKGQPGQNGNGIVSITKTSTSGNVDTYTILYTNGNSDTFTVTNGNSTAVSVTYSNTVSGLASTNVQDAIDELADTDDDIQAVMRKNGAINSLPINGVSGSNNGLTWSFNEDGSLSINGTASADTTIYFTSNCTIDVDAFRSTNKFVLSGDGVNIAGVNTVFITGTYKYTSGGATVTVPFFATLFDEPTPPGTTVTEKHANVKIGNSNPSYLMDKWSMSVSINSGVSFSNNKIYMMLIPTEVTDFTFVPYAFTNREITKKMVSGSTDAADVSYDNTVSGLTADDVQEAIDEVVTDMGNNHKVTSLTVDTSNWTQDTTSQSGTTLYKKQISLNHVYAMPEVDIAAASGSTLPTTDEQAAYDLVQYVTVDVENNYLYLYASDIPQTAFYINVEGAD